MQVHIRGVRSGDVIDNALHKKKIRTSYLLVDSGNFTTYCVECNIIVRKHEDRLVLPFLMLYFFMSLSGLVYCQH